MRDEMTDDSPYFPRLDVRPPNFITADHDAKMADTMYDRVMQQIIAFQDDLDVDEEVGAALAHFGQLVVIHVDSVGYHNPELMMIFGRDQSGNEVTLLQHLSQVNILLKAVKVNPGEKPRRIGFHSEDDAENG